VRGELHAADKSIALELQGVIRPYEDELDVDMTTFADHRQLGMTLNRLGAIRSPSKPIVRGGWSEIPAGFVTKNPRPVQPRLPHPRVSGRVSD
jgi:hypothetical protein